MYATVSLYVIGIVYILGLFDQRRLGVNRTVDPLSLILSLDGMDERMEMEIEDLLDRTLGV